MNIIEYIKGKRKGKAVNRLEREAMRDPFLQDALDGYDSIDGDHIKNIESLQDRIRQITSTKKQRSFLITKKRLAIAASFAILIVGISFLIIEIANRPKTLLSTSQETREGILKNDTIDKGEESIQIKDTLLLVDASPAREKERKGSPVTIPEHVTIADDSFDYYVYQEPLEDFSSEKEEETGNDTMMLAMDAQKHKNRKIQDALSDMEKTSSIDGEITSVRGNRSSSQTVVVEGVRARESNSLTSKEKLEKYVIENFNKHLCPDLKGEVLVKIFIDRMDGPEVIDIKGTDCKAFKDELERLLKEADLWNMRGQRVKLKFTF